MDFLESINAFQLVCGFLALVFALMVVISRNAVISAVCLMGTMFMTAALYFALGSFFMGAVQVLIYAGAVAVLFVFIVMLLDIRPSSIVIPGKSIFFGAAAVITLTIVAFSIIVLMNASILKSGTLFPGEFFSADQVEQSMHASSIANYFLSTHMLPFQATGFIVLSAILGVVFLGRKPKDSSSVEDV